MFFSKGAILSNFKAPNNQISIPSSGDCCVAYPIHRQILVDFHKEKHWRSSMEMLVGGFNPSEKY